MKKEDLEILLRSVGVDENTVTAMGNAYDIGYETGAQDGYNKHLMVLTRIGGQDESKAN